MTSANKGGAPSDLLETAGDIRCIPRASGEIPALAREHLGRELRSFYDAVLTEEQPSRLLQLIARLGDALTAQDAAASAEFRTALIAALPGLRAFAMSLAVETHRADDLVQETVLKAWANRHRFEPGSNFKAWLCTILRNQFYTEIRKRKREVEDVDDVLSGQLIAPAAQEDSSELRTIWGRMAKLPPAQREALMLVAVQGMTYEAAADLTGSQVGTMKSRVNRARAALMTGPPRLAGSAADIPA